MNKSVWILVVGMLAGATAPARAEKKTPPTALGAAEPPAELLQFKFLVGSWSCAGKTMATSLSPERPNGTLMTIQTNPGEFWYTVRYEEKKFKDTTSPSKGYGMIAFDPTSKFFTITAQEDSGMNCSQRTPGFTSNQAEWRGDMFVQGKKITYREIFVKKGDTELFIINETALNNGEWRKATETTCKKL